MKARQVIEAMVGEGNIHHTLVKKLQRINPDIYDVDIIGSVIYVYFDKEDSETYSIINIDLSDGTTWITDFKGSGGDDRSISSFKTTGDLVKDTVSIVTEYFR